MKTYTYNEISVGHEESFFIDISNKKAEMFRLITGDENPLHSDETYAISKGYDGKVAHGMLTASFLSTLAGMFLPGKHSLIHGVDIKFIKPVILDNGKLTVKGVVKEKSDIFKLLTIKVTIEDSHGNKVCRGTMKVGVTDE